MNDELKKEDWLLVAGLSLVLALCAAWAPFAKREKAYQAEWAAAHPGSRVEIVLPDKNRIDILSGDGVWAIEVGFAGHREDLAQVMLYAMATGRRAAILWIVADTDKDRKSVEEMRTIIQHYGLDVQVWTVAK